MNSAFNLCPTLPIHPFSSFFNLRASHFTRDASRFHKSQPNTHTLSTKKSLPVIFSAAPTGPNDDIQVKFKSRDELLQEIRDEGFLSDMYEDQISPNSAYQPSLANSPKPQYPSIDFFQLQNGSDIRGVATDFQYLKMGKESHLSENVTLSPNAACFISAAFVQWLAKRNDVTEPNITIAVGRDPRVSGPELVHAVKTGTIYANGSIADFDLATTPAMFMATITRVDNLWTFDGAIMITASHLPPDRNGMKFFTSQGGLNKKDIKEILERAEQLYKEHDHRKMTFRYAEECAKTVTHIDFLSIYAQQLCDLIRTNVNHPTHYDTPLTGCKIVVDAGNGSGGFFANKVLKVLGADITGSQFLEPDGLFPNHTPNPEDKKAMAMTVEAVLQNHADLGVVFDTDVDRSGVVDSRGQVVNKSKLIALLAAIVLQEHPNTCIVTDSTTTNGLADFIKKRGGVHYRYKKGYKNIIDKAIQLNQEGIETHLAIETSGHGAMKENYMLDDGAYLAVKIIIQLVKMKLQSSSSSLLSLINDLTEPLEAREFRFVFFNKNNFQEQGNKILEALAKDVQKIKGWKLEEENHEGYRVAVDEGNGNSGWFLLRQSLHDPVMVLNVESDVENGVRAIMDTLVHEVLCKHETINFTEAQAFLKIDSIQCRVGYDATV